MSKCVWRCIVVSSRETKWILQQLKFDFYNNFKLLFYDDN